jgi:hypothetical protein
MIKLVFCLHRLPELSRAQFLDQWRNVQAPLFSVREHEFVEPCCRHRARVDGAFLAA